MKRDVERNDIRRIAGYGAIGLLTGVLLGGCKPKGPTLRSEDGCNNDLVLCELEFSQSPGKPVDLKSLVIETDGVEVNFTEVCERLGFQDKVSTGYCETRLGPGRPCADEGHIGNTCSYPEWKFEVKVNDNGIIKLAGAETSAVELSEIVNGSVIPPREYEVSVSGKPSFGETALMIGGYTTAAFIGLSALAFIAMIKQTRSSGLTAEQIKRQKEEKRIKKEALRETRKYIEKRGGVEVTERDETGTVFKGFATNHRKVAGIHGLSEVPADVTYRPIAEGLDEVIVSFARFDELPETNIPVSGVVIPRRRNLLKDIVEGGKHNHVVYEDL